MKIVQAPAQVLSQKAKPLEKVDKAIKKLLKEMEQTLLAQTDPEGVGLAAPQVGQSLQIFIVKQDPESPLMTFINPTIKKTFEKTTDKKAGERQSKKAEKVKISSKSGSASDGDKGVQLEGCLSLKDVWGVVKRPFGVELTYLDETGTQHNKKFDGFLATIIQHEIDHLNGILFPKRVLDQKNPLYHSVKNVKGEIEFEEIEI